MASPLVELEYRHVRDGTTDEEDEEYNSDWDVGMYGGYAAQAGGLGRVRSMLRHLLLMWRLAICVLRVGHRHTCLGSMKSMGMIF